MAWTANITPLPGTCTHDCTCVCIQMWTCSRICVCVWVYVSKWIVRMCTYSCRHDRAHVCIYVRKWLRMCTYFCRHDCAHVCIYACRHYCANVCIYVQAWPCLMCAYMHAGIIVPMCAYLHAGIIAPLCAYSCRHDCAYLARGLVGIKILWAQDKTKRDQLEMLDNAYAHTCASMLMRYSDK
jgi:hypothetical protein